MRTILFTVVLLIFTASAHATGPAPKTGECKPTTAQINDHQVTYRCEPNGGVTEKSEWRKSDQLDRADSPAVIERDAKTGIVTIESWWKNGKRHRADGPAVIRHDDPTTGIVTYEEWWRDGKLDRTDGPAIIWRDAKNHDTYEAWFKDGKEITPP